MTPEQNHKEVIANDNDIKRQVPLITTAKEKKEMPNKFMNEELFLRSIGR